MSGDSPESSGSSEELRSEVARLLAHAEEAARRANSEAGFAFNAKGAAEEHARFVAQLRGAVEADASWLSATKKNAEDVQSALSASKASADVDAAALTEMRAQAKSDSASVRAVNAAVSSIQTEVESLRERSIEASRAATSAAVDVATNKAAVEAALTSVQATHAAIAEAASSAVLSAKEIEKLESGAKVNATYLDEAVESATDVDVKVKAHEAELVRLLAEYTALNKKVESMLPGATSAGLASAFRIQKERFVAPSIGWLIVFVLTLAALFGMGLYDFQAAEPTWDAMLRHFANRLPIIIPLVWLAIYSGRHYSLALKLQEDYAFKEAVSFAFEGYKREMANIPSVEGQQNPLVILCENVLSSLAQRPGRIYENKHEDVTPLSPLKSLIAEALAAIRAASSKQSGQ
ncbi:MAG: hypothetical protein J0H69_08765 [Burkholderiales bacterium]|nr:hypothetical protein [Burkholderiales bacterium]